MTKHVLNLLAIVVLVSLAAEFSAAAVNPVYQPAGAPADPKVRAQWNSYLDYAASTDLMKRLTAAHPNLCQLRSLGTSYGGREMWVMTISDFSAIDETHTEVKIVRHSGSMAEFMPTRFRPRR